MTKVSPLLLLLAALAFSSIEARLGNSRRQQKLRGVKQLPRSLLQGFGGSPDSSKFPLQKCQGDCDVDEGEYCTDI